MAGLAALSVVWVELRFISLNIITQTITTVISKYQKSNLIQWTSQISWTVDGNPHYYICEPVAADKNLESNKEDKQDTFCNHCNENEFLGDPKLQSQQARCIKILQ